MDEDSVLGSENLSFGPGVIYADTGAGGKNIFLGETDSVKITMNTTKIELKTSQYGEAAKDKAVSTQSASITLGLAEATLKRLESVQQGLIVDRDSTSGLATRLHFGSVIGQRDSTIKKQYTFFEYIDGVEADPEKNPLHIIDFYETVASNESVELVFDSSTQRYYATMLTVYRSETHKHPVTGQKLFFSSREGIATTGVTVDPTTWAGAVGETQQLTPTVEPSNASFKSVQYSTSDSLVAAVDENGLITAVGSGSCVITVTTDYGAFTDTCDVTIS